MSCVIWFVYHLVTNSAYYERHKLAQLLDYSLILFKTESLDNASQEFSMALRYHVYDPPYLAPQIW